MLPAVQVKLPESTTGASAGSWAFLRGTGSLFGVAIPSAVFNVRFSSLLSTISSEKARASLANGQAYQHATVSFISRYPAAKNEIINAFSESLKSVWIVFTIVAGVGFLLTWGERQHKMRTVLDTQYGLKPSKKGVSTTTTPGETPASTPPTSMPGSEIFPGPASVVGEDPFLSESERRRKREREMERVDSSCMIEMAQREREMV